MAIFIENEIDAKFDFDYNEVIESVINEAANYVGCPYEISVEVTIVDNETIRQINKEQRDIDNPTDVLSFPMVEYEVAGDFEFLDKDDPYVYEYFEPDTGELVLGDIVISSEKVYSQAEEYGHSPKREFCFLDGNLNLIDDKTYRTIENDDRCTKQDICADANLLYFILWDGRHKDMEDFQNRVTIYDWNGDYKGVLEFNLGPNEPESISVLDGEIYAVVVNNKEPAIYHFEPMVK